MIRGYQAKLPKGRKVFVGISDDPKLDGYCVKFTNRSLPKADRETCLRISKESFDAMIELRKLLDRASSIEVTINNLVWEVAGKMNEGR